jgi:hypothetical protein
MDRQSAEGATVPHLPQNTHKFSVEIFGKLPIVSSSRVQGTQAATLAQARNWFRRRGKILFHPALTKASAVPLGGRMLPTMETRHEAQIF